MTPDLEAIRQRAERATPGPWFTRGRPELRPQVWGPKPGLHGNYCLFDDSFGYATVFDAEFIAHAREDIPALLAEVDRLTALVGEPRDDRHEPEADAGDDRSAVVNGTGLVELPARYWAEGTSGTGFDPKVLRAAAEMHRRHAFDHAMTVKAPVVLYLLDAEACLVSHREALGALLDWAERYRFGDKSLDPEEWYVTSEHARRVLGEGAPPHEQSEADTGGSEAARSGGSR